MVDFLSETYNEVRIVIGGSNHGELKVAAQGNLLPVLRVG